MKPLVDAILEAPLIHQRLYALVELIRYVEDKIDRNLHTNEPMIDEQVQRLRQYHLQFIDLFQSEQVILQKTTVNTGMMLFVCTCRFELHMHEPSWRETDAHLRIEDIAPQWIEDDFIPQDPNPILFMSCSKILQLIQRFQRFWYTKSFDPPTLKTFLKWLERRSSLLITFHFDDVTFDLKQYRQKNGGDFIANMALAYDFYSYFTSFYQDIVRYERLQMSEVQEKEYDETKCNDLIHHIILNVQGDSLCIDFQKQFVNHAVRIADRWIFSRRRPEVVGGSDMEIITECNGRKRAETVHTRADCVLKDIVDDPTQHDLLWIVVITYYFNQKCSFPWQEACYVNRATGSMGYEETCDLPVIIHIPVMNVYGVLEEGKCIPHSSFTQAFLYWVDLMIRKYEGIWVYKHKRILMKEILEEFI